MATQSKKSTKAEPGILEVIVQLDDMKTRQEWPNIAAYVFTRSGTFLSKALLEPDDKHPSTGKATFSLEVRIKERLVVKIGPDIDDVRSLERYQPFADKSVLIPDKKATLRFTIHRPGWLCWLKVPYLVKGNVQLQGGEPICNGDVDIYDVDIGFCFLRLSDAIIEMLRRAVIDIVTNPPPLQLDELPQYLYWDDDWCGTGPKPSFPHDG